MDICVYSGLIKTYENSEKKNQLQNCATSTSKLICRSTLQRMHNSNIHIRFFNALCNVVCGNTHSCFVL